MMQLLTLLLIITLCCFVVVKLKDQLQVIQKQHVAAQEREIKLQNELRNSQKQVGSYNYSHFHKYTVDTEYLIVELTTLAVYISIYFSFIVA